MGRINSFIHLLFLPFIHKVFTQSLVCVGTMLGPGDGAVRGKGAVLPCGVCDLAAETFPKEATWAECLWGGPRGDGRSVQHHPPSHAWLLNPGKAASVTEDVKI